jgi:acylphosphatase
VARHVNIRVTGKVQGVYYRATAKEVADGLGLTGFVRNESGGSVYIEAEGDSAGIEQLIVWCRHGPPRAVVSNVEVTDDTVRGFPGFEAKGF